MNIIALVKYVTRHPLNRGAPFQAMGRYVRWQLATRLLNHAVAVPFVNDTRLLIKRGMWGAAANWYCGLDEPAEMGFLLHLLRKSDSFFDVGANVGSFTILAAGAVGAHVTAIEPVPATFENLRANIRLNNAEAGVEALCCGVASAPAVLRFVSTHDCMNRVALDDEQEDVIEVPVRTLDNISQGRVPRLIKIDVEGYELFVLRGAQKLLSSPDLLAIIMETNQSGLTYGVTHEQLVEELAAYGFGPCSYDPFERTLHPLTAANMQGNTIFARDPEALTAICRAAPRFRLCNGAI